jgi:GT2 family glycosyltransferase
VWQQLGGLDERFFLQMEETDFWMRAKPLGVRSLCDTRVRIHHVESRTFGDRMTPGKSYYIARNTLLLAEKHSLGLGGWLRAWRSVYWFAGKLAAANGAGTSRRAMLRWLFSASPHSRAIRAGIFDYVRRRFGRMSPAGRRAVGP